MIPMTKEMTFPEKIVTFPIYQDVVSSDGELIKDYLSAIAENDFISAGNALSQMNHFANKVIGTKDWQLMYDTVKAAKKVVDDFAPEAETPGENLTNITMGNIEPTSPKGNDLWIGVCESSYTCSKVELSDTSIKLKTGQTFKIEGTVHSKETSSSTQIAGHTNSSPTITKIIKIKNTTKINANKNILSSIQTIPNEYWNNGTFYIYITPVVSGTYILYGLVGYKSFTVTITVTSTDHINLYFNGFTEDNCIYSISKKKDGISYNTFQTRNSTSIFSMYNNRYLTIMEEDGRDWPVVVRQVTSDGTTFTNVTSSLTDSGDKFNMKLLCYEFFVTKECGIDLVGADDIRRTQSTSSEYIGYYSADYVILIDLDYTVNEEGEEL